MCVVSGGVYVICLTASHAHAHALFLEKHGLSAAVQTTVTCAGKPGSLADVSRLVECSKKRNSGNSEEWEELGSYWRNDIIYSELSLLAGGKGTHVRTLASVLGCAF